MYRVAILTDNQPESASKWGLALQKKSMDAIVVNMLRDDWLMKIQIFDPDFCVSRPPADIQQHKKIFDEKLFFLEHSTSYSVYPGFKETYIYENKAALAWFLKTNKIPHPETFLSSEPDEVNAFLEKCEYPLVAKTLIGATGSGVVFLNDKKGAKKYAEKAFKTGIRRRYGPNRKTGTSAEWIAKAIQSPGYLLKRLKLYKKRYQDIQKGVVLFQKYIPHDFEWRSVRIGESYFAYKKLKKGDQASGAKLFEYGAPPKEILDFSRDLCEKHQFYFMAVDLFYDGDRIFVNELQTIFGHKSDAICKVNGKPGRYLYRDKAWMFEEGMFNSNESYDLRLHTAIELQNGRGR